jgi:hypothetical protein
MVRAELPLEIGQELLEQRDRLGEPTSTACAALSPS